MLEPNQAEAKKAKTEFSDVARKIKTTVFYANLNMMPWWKAWIVHTVRIIYAITQDIIEDRITMRATSLVYTTLLSIVPTLAIVFSVLRAFNYQEKLEETLISFLAPMGDRGVEITDYIMQLVERVDPGVLGSAGLVFLIYAIISMVSKVEGAINEIWGVDSHRPLVRRFTDYLSAVILGPFLIIIVLGIMANFFSGAAAEAIPGMSQASELINIALPNALIIFIFLFLYKALPNDRVSLVSALIGAICACLLWQVGSLVFSYFVASSSRLAELYSVFATIIIFFIWLNFAWLTILVGASITYYHQYPLEAVSRKFLRTPAAMDLRRLSVEVALLIAKSFKEGEKPWSSEAIAERLNVPKKLVDYVLSSMERNRLIYAIDSRPQGYVFAHPLADITIKKVIDASKIAETPQFKRQPVSGIDSLLYKVNEAERDILKSVTLESLIEEQEQKESANKE